ncbi:MAG: SirB2 family protein [Candidatus Thiodiazotropha sp.]
MDTVSLYPYIKLLHVTTVIITGSLFLLRFVWMLQGRLEMRGAWVRTLPHYNDTLLFISGLSMAWIIDQLPLQAQKPPVWRLSVAIFISSPSHSAATPHRRFRGCFRDSGLLDSKHFFT